MALLLVSVLTLVGAYEPFQVNHVVTACGGASAPSHRQRGEWLTLSRVTLGGSEGGMHYVMHYVTICNALCNYMLGGAVGTPPQKVIVRGGGVEHPPLEV